MSAQPHTATEGQQDALFGDPATVTDKPTRVSRPVTQDVELVASVVRLAVEPGYRVVEKSGRVFRVDPGTKGEVQEIPRYEADTVMQLVDAGLLELGGNHTITYRDRTGPSRSVLAPKDTRNRVARWGSLKPLPAASSRPGRSSTGTNTQTGAPARNGGQRPESGPIGVDVVEPGKALVSITGAGVGGTITRNREPDDRHGRGGYLVENDDGRVLGSVSSFRAGAQKLARHYGYRPGPVEIEHEHRNNPPF